MIFKTKTLKPSDVEEKIFDYIVVHLKTLILH